MHLGAAALSSIFALPEAIKLQHFLQVHSNSCSLVGDVSQETLAWLVFLIYNYEVIKYAGTHL